MPGFIVHRQTNFASRGRSTGFSLVEMVVVMGILVILLAVVLPSFRGLNQSGMRKAAVSNLMGVLDRARTMAVSDGKATYVVFYAAHTPPTGALTNSANGPWGNSYAIYQDADNVSFNPLQLTPWLPLPAGIAFKVSTEHQMTSVTNILDLLGSAGGDPDAATTGANSLPQFPVSSNVTSASSPKKHLYLPFFKFDNTGALDQTLVNQPTNYLRVLMFPGYLKPDGTEVATQANAQGNSLALEEIDLNPVTGRAKYVVNPVDNLYTPPPTGSPQS